MTCGKGLSVTSIYRRIMPYPMLTLPDALRKDSLKEVCPSLLSATLSPWLRVANLSARQWLDATTFCALSVIGDPEALKKRQSFWLEVTSQLITFWKKHGLEPDSPLKSIFKAEYDHVEANLKDPEYYLEVVETLGDEWSQVSRLGWRLSELVEHRPLMRNACRAAVHSFDTGSPVCLNTHLFEGLTEPMVRGELQKLWDIHRDKTRPVIISHYETAYYAVMHQVDLHLWINSP